MMDIAPAVMNAARGFTVSVVYSLLETVENLASQRVQLRQELRDSRI